MKYNLVAFLDFEISEVNRSKQGLQAHKNLLIKLDCEIDESDFSRTDEKLDIRLGHLLRIRKIVAPIQKGFSVWEYVKKYWLYLK